MEKTKAKGTVSSLSSMFPAEEAQKAARRVQDAMSEKQEELNRVRGFIADNTNLINLVQKLPEELHHDIMVPFGKAAFFPGRLIHTNEILVLLGEGYYAERTSKQTVEILKRRGKVLESQVDSLKAMIKDLQMEASFFDATASEAAEGLIEIREDYVEEKSEMASESGLLKQDNRFSEANKSQVEDEEYAHIMSRLDELEQEELAAESDSRYDKNKEIHPAEADNESDEDKQAKDEEYARIMSRLDELEQEELAAQSDNRNYENRQNNSTEDEKESDENEQAKDEDYAHIRSRFDELVLEKLAAESDNRNDDGKRSNTAEDDNESDEDKQAKGDFNEFPDQISLGRNIRYSKELISCKPPRKTKDKNTSAVFSNNLCQESFTDQSCTGLTVQAVPKDNVSHGRSTADNAKFISAEKSLMLPEAHGDVGAAPSSRKEVSAQTSKAGFDRGKAFTGSIVEHTHNIQTSPVEQLSSSKPSVSQPSKPVSRFKMQRR